MQRSRSFLFTVLVILALSMYTGFVCYSAGAVTLPLAYNFEDGSGNGRDPQTYYTQKTPTLNLSSTQHVDGTTGLHFITGTSSGNWSIIKNQMPTAQNFSQIANNYGTISFDLWLSAPSNLLDTLGNRTFQYAIGNNAPPGYPAEQNYIFFNIDSSYLTANAWNHVELRLALGTGQMGCTLINGVQLGGSSSITTSGGAVDWNNINYNGWTFRTPTNTVEGYIDNCAIESGVNGSFPIFPKAAYTLQPPTFEVGSYQGKSNALYFVTSSAQDIIENSNWSTPMDMSIVADDGAVTMDVYLANPMTLNFYGQHVWRFVLGSTNTNQYMDWGVDASTFTANAWNHVVLKVCGGQSTLQGSTVNGVPLAGRAVGWATNQGVTGAAIDFTNLNRHQFEFFSQAGAVTGYVANLSTITVDALYPHDVRVMSGGIEPYSHKTAAYNTYNVPNVFDTDILYDIIPPSVQSTAFFTSSTWSTGDLLHWENGPTYWISDYYSLRWTAFPRSSLGSWPSTYANFTQSNDQSIRGPSGQQCNAHIDTWMTDQVNPEIILRPFTPKNIGIDFNAIDLWIYGNRYLNDATLSLTFMDNAGKLFWWNGGTEYLTGPGHLFSNWQMAHIVLPKVYTAPSKLVAIKIIPKQGQGVGGELLYYIDQMQAMNTSTYLSTTPAPTYTHTGAITLPQNSTTAACPATIGTAPTITVTKYSTYATLKWTQGSKSVTYKYTPSSGTLSDLTVTNTNGRVFTPAAGSGPIFNYSGNIVSVPAGQATAAWDNFVQNGNTITCFWTYSSPYGTSCFAYYFSMRGKTLVIDVASNNTNTQSWEFGNATGLSTGTPKIVEVPGMVNSPNMLVYDSNFCTYYPDWYLSNVSESSYGTNWVAGSTAGYSFAAGCYTYLPSTNGTRNAFSERFYITDSDVVDDCLYSISNPASPNQTNLANHLYRMANPGKPVAGSDWVSMVKSNLDQYISYGMTDMYFMLHDGLWCNRPGAGSEEWTVSGKTSVMTPYGSYGSTPWVQQYASGDACVQALFNYMKTNGFTPGYYWGSQLYEPVSEVWSYNDVILKPDSNWRSGWVQIYLAKPWRMGDDARGIFTTTANKFRPSGGGLAAYEDSWTAGSLWENNDYDQRMSERGKFIDTLRAVACGFNNERAALPGPVFSEGSGANFYNAGLNDGDYFKLKGYSNGQSPATKNNPLLVDFQLKKVNQKYAPIGVDLCYYVYANDSITSNDPGNASAYDSANNYLNFYQYLATEIAFGCMGEVEQIWPLQPSQNVGNEFRFVMDSYFMLRQLQCRYIMQPVSSVAYWNGTIEESTSAALIDNAYTRNQVHITYTNGLQIWVNGNWSGNNWDVWDAGTTYRLPPGGWYAKDASGFQEFSAIPLGWYASRMNFVNSSSYTYLNGVGQAVTWGGLSVAANQVKVKFAGQSERVWQQP